MYEHAFEHRGNKADFVLGTSLYGWRGFEVVRFHAVEELSRPFQFDILLRRRANEGPADLDGLIGTGPAFGSDATFRIATERRWRSVHGILSEAEEVDRTESLFYYRVLLVPHIMRAMHRRRCRTFVNKTLKEILTFALENRSQKEAAGISGLVPSAGPPSAPEAMPSFNAFQPPRGEYIFRVADDTRLNDPALYRFVAQYNEPDFHFIARLLEREGLSYYFEHTRDAAVMVITDKPGQSPLFAEDETLTMRSVAKGGASAGQEVVRGLKDARRMRSRAVAMRDYDWRRSNQVFTAESTAVEADPHIAGHFEFPAGDELLEEKPAAFAAAIRMERFEVERNLRDGSGTARVMEPGHRVKLHSGDGLRDDIELLMVRVESMATQHDVAGSELEGEPFGFGAAPQALGAYENRFSVLAADIPFRPALSTSRPRIHGIQIARVTAEEAYVTIETDAGVTVSPPDIHCDEHGNVRVRFPWDQRKPEENTPSSDWVRVSHYWAGNGYGAQHVPRVGQEVLVAFLQGDPDRPVIVGRVYNPQSPVPYPPDASAKAKTQTAWKSASSSVTEATEGFNEIRFTDYTGEQEIYLQAEKDLNELVKDSHSTTVGGDQSYSVGNNQSNTVGNNQSNSVGNNRTHAVTGTESVHVHGDRTTQFDANEKHSVDGYLTTRVGINETHEVGSFRGSKVGANDDLDVSGWRNTTVGAGENRTVAGPDKVTVAADRRVLVGGDHIMTAAGNHDVSAAFAKFKAVGFNVTSMSADFEQSTIFSVNVGGATISVMPGMIRLDNGAGASISLVGATIVVSSGGTTNLFAGGDINAKAPNIKLNG
ncbi:MAG: type VI secretion system tip protein VgrG [Polyangiaceae bacterium]|nr:type VI secretion system tip protein VgrG [Polyangiaceae bacterium]